MMTYDNNAPISRFGRTFKAWTKRQLLDMTARLPLTKAERALVSYSDMMRYAGSIHGIDHALAIACGGTEAEMERIASISQKSQLVGELIDIMIGAYTAPDETTEDAPAPFVETVVSGK